MSRTESPEFLEVATPMLAAGLADGGTVMGHPCLRVHGNFIAMAHHQEPGLVVKLSRARVAELIASGEGRPFAPAGRPFGEWVHIPRHERAAWEELLTEAREFALR